jgi:hypothetical protein
MTGGGAALGRTGCGAEEVLSPLRKDTSRPAGEPEAAFERTTIPSAANPPRPSGLLKSPNIPLVTCCPRPQGKGIYRLIAFLVAGMCGWCPTTRAQQTGHPPRLVFTKEFKGATPEYLAIAVDTTGAATYEGRRLDEPSRSRPLRLSPATTARLFELAARLHYFQGLELESHRRVANLGWKTLRYEKDGKTNQVQFNYTLRADANELAEWFERIATVAQHRATLEYAMKYDPLDLPRALQQIKKDLAQKALADPQVLAPILAQITQNSRYLNVAKTRAQDILQQIQDKR